MTPGEKVVHALRGSKTLGFDVVERLVNEAIAEEREACAKVCDEVESENRSGIARDAHICAERIRSRG